MTTPAPPPPPIRRRSTPWVRALLGTTAVVGIIALATLATGESDPLELTHTFPDDYLGPVWVEIGADGTTSHEVTVRWGRLSTTFTHEGPGTETYHFDRGTIVYGRSGPLEVTVDPPADVTFDHGPVPIGGIDIGATPWEAEPEQEVGRNRPAAADRPLAAGVVNEYISYGLVVEGVGIYSGPAHETDLVGVVHHGDTLDADCWVEGPEITNSNLEDPADDLAAYTSTVWFHVQGPEGPGYIPDAFFSRSGTSDRMNLPECTGTP